MNVFLDTNFDILVMTPAEFVQKAKE